MQEDGACVNVPDCPAMVTVEVSTVPVVLAATLTTTVPDAVPEAPEATVAQVWLLVAVHVQPDGASTEKMSVCAGL